MTKRSRNIRIIFLLIVSGIMITFHSCMTFRMSEKEIDKFFTSKHVKGTQHSYSVGFRHMHYVKAGDETKPLVVFLHGSPGSLSAFIDFLADTSLLTNALLITADRPGFGYSNFGLGEPSLQKQSELLKPILEEHKNNRPIILVGHSLGGPVIARMAIDYPELIDGLIIVAGSIDPDLEPNETWFRAPLSTPFLSWILPRSFRASNDEIYKLKPELENLRSQLSKITCPVIVIQGEKDSLVDPGNAAYIKKMFTNAHVDQVMVKDMNHFVPWSNPELINDAILKMIKK
jgi:pimeloyl-ACP methyl ester carboxylesterase